MMFATLVAGGTPEMIVASNRLQHSGYLTADFHIEEHAIAELLSFSLERG